MRREQGVVQSIVLLAQVVGFDACMRTRGAKFARKTETLGESHRAGKPLPRVCGPRRSLELSFERVVFVSGVMGDDDVACDEVDQLGENLLEMGLVLKLLQ